MIRTAELSTKKAVLLPYSHFILNNEWILWDFSFLRSLLFGASESFRQTSMCVLNAFEIINNN